VETSRRTASALDRATGPEVQEHLMQHGNHLKQMLIVGGVLLVGLLAFGVPTGSALVTAAALACPIGMVAMMFFMMRGSQAQDSGHNGSHSHSAAPAPERIPAGPQE
jgi:hypothetical protein